MSSISIKGIIVGALFDAVASLVLGAGLVIAIVASSGVANIEDTSSIAYSGTFAVVGYAISGGTSVLAGYIAARIAGRGELINGTLASMVCVVIVTGFTLADMDTATIVEFLMTPLLGLFGGYLRLRQVSSAHA
jgi:hypothetical protein